MGFLWDYIYKHASPYINELIDRDSVINVMIPIRCMTCGKPVGQYWEKYRKEIKAGKNPQKVLDSLGLERYCCRSLFLTHVDLAEKVGKFKK